VRSWFPAATTSTPPGKAPSMRAAWSSLQKWQRTWLVCWWVFLIVPATIGYVVLTSQQEHNRQEAAQRHRERMDPAKNDALVTKLELAPPAGHEHDPPAVRVNTGAYVTRIPKHSIVESSWHVDFYIWFSWEGAAVNPGETFKIVSGEITSKALMRRTDEGDKHYALYRVNAEITKAFDTARFPRDEHVLTLVIEDQGLQYYQMLYTTDEALSALSSRVDIAGYAVTRKQTVVKPHTYKTSMGDPSLPADYKATYSDFVLAITIARPTWGVFIKMFLPLYLAVLLALVALLVRGPGERLGLTSTALFVAVINGMTINATIPDTGTTTLADVISILGYVVIGQTILQSIFYHRYFAEPTKDQDAALLLDRSTLVILTLQALVLNVGVVMAASA
jgi:hypothetical protein